LTPYQTKAMVSWILSLGEEKSKEDRLPLNGNFIAEEQPMHEKGYKVHGTYVLSVSYTDNGFEKMKAITVREQVLLKPPLFPAIIADYISFPNPDLREKWLRNIKPGDEFVFNDLDLTDIAGLKMQYRGNKDTAKAFKIILKSDIEVLGELAVVSEGLEVKEAFIPFENVEGLYNLHVSVEAENALDALDFGYLQFEKKENKLLSQN